MINVSFRKCRDQIGVNKTGAVRLVCKEDDMDT